MTDIEWQKTVDSLNALRTIVESWPACEPDPGAMRCESSRHRTLAHLRAAQATWLEAVLLFESKNNPSITRPNPWRLFEGNGYSSIPWEEHRRAYLADRSAWQELLQRPGLDRNRGGKLSRKVHTIASLTSLLVRHEAYHIGMFP